MIEELRSVEELCGYLGLSVNHVRYLADSRNCSQVYHAFVVPKRDGGSRLIEAPRSDLKWVQHLLLKLLSSCYAAPASVHGFTQGKSIVTNACCHVGKRVVVSLDIKDFFPSITKQRIAGLLKKSPFSCDDDVASLVASLVVGSRGLPQGSPTSPILANMVCRGMDRKLSHAAYRLGAFYTRYADDVTFSFRSRKAFESAFLSRGTFSVPKDVEEAICKSGRFDSFSINEEKTRFRDNRCRQSVTGITVNRKLNLPRSFYRKLRTCLHRWSVSGPEDAARSYYRLDSPSSGQIAGIENVLRGCLSYYSMVLGENARASTPLQKLGSSFNRLCQGRRFPVCDPRDSIFLLSVEIDGVKCPEKADLSNEATCFLLEGYGIVTAKHTFDKAKCVNGSYEVEFKNLASGEMALGSLKIDLNREHPGYDYIIIPTEEAPCWIRDMVPLASARYAPCAGECIRAFEARAVGAGERILEEVDGALRKLPGRANQYGAIAGTDANFAHGMSGGPVLNSRCEVVGSVYTASLDREFSRFLTLASIENFPEEIAWIA